MSECEKKKVGVGKKPCLREEGVMSDNGEDGSSKPMKKRTSWESTLTGIDPWQNEILMTMGPPWEILEAS
jgi:hypothetical protein